LRLDGSPYYVGKGKRNRAYITHKTQSISTPKDRSRIKLQYWSDEETAIAYEIYQIDFWGRKDIGTGILRNRTDGGEGVSGFKNPHTEEWKKKVSEAHKGKIVPQELREQISRKLKGTKVPPERIAKQSAAQMGRKPSAESVEKTRLANIGRKYPQEYKDNLSLIVTKQWEDPGYREKQSKAHNRPWSQKRREAFEKKRRAQDAL